MQGQLLGLLDPLFKILESVFKVVIEWILTPLINLVIAPVINAVTRFIMYVIGLYLYSIGSFLLALVDFVEQLFRALAGLTDGSAITLSLDGRNGDILLQLIQNKDIQSAFLAMCIVGLFLLIITSVFQIIKVEYTTEGAKNAKGPILQKAFKGLANLMLLPLLVCFGIILANQVLGLLDKATRADVEGNPTISGTIFACAASDAYYRKGDQQVIVTTTLPQLAIYQVLSNIVPIMFQSIGDSWDATPDDTPMFDNKDEIEEKFIVQDKDYKYYYLGQVSQYYDYSQINYFMLIFATIVVLKAFFFTCFGMVIRLYKCAMLFIISPAVIGMTPINEGGLGKWRGSFIGQVLSAYGTVLSVNLFLIIVRVLLNIDLKIQGNMALTSNLMTQLFKTILVIAGALLIEKFSKEIGGYFGAEDAMSAGKDMAKQVGDVAMKGVKVAAGVASVAATGGASLAAGGLSLAKRMGGAAKGVGQNIKGRFDETREKNGGKLGFKGAVKGVVTGTGSSAWKGIKSGANGVKDWTLNKTAPGKLVKRGMDAHKYHKAVKDKESNEAYLQEFNETRENDLKEYRTLKNKPNRTQEENDRLNLLESSQTSSKQATNIRKRFKSNIAEDDKIIKKHEDDKKARAIVKADKRVKRENQFMAFSSGLRGFGEDALDMLPGRKSWSSAWKGAEDRGAKLMGPEFEASVGDVRYQRDKERQDSYKERYGAVIDSKQRNGIVKVMNNVVEEANFKANSIKLDANQLANELSKAYSQTTNQDDRVKLMTSYLAQMRSLGANIDYDSLESKIKADGGSMNMDLSLNDLKVDFDAKKIEAAVQNAVAKGGTKEEILQEMHKLFDELGKDGNTSFMKMIAQIVEKEISKLGSK